MSLSHHGRLKSVGQAFFPGLGVRVWAAQAALHGRCKSLLSHCAQQKNLKKYQLEGLTVFRTLHKMRATCSEHHAAG
ncbi:hypothetical protein, partial [Halopseudomonas aestusnigri]|uniref:hypothetical protein n=1 Tax=Halopseudomonas aestusnigri TaxID=857252 RepID=UPI001C0EA986